MGKYEDLKRGLISSTEEPPAPLFGGNYERLKYSIKTNTPYVPAPGLPERQPAFEAEKPEGSEIPPFNPGGVKPFPLRDGYEAYKKTAEIRQKQLDTENPLYHKDDATLTNQNIMEKYEAILQDASLPSWRRNELAKQGMKTTIAITEKYTGRTRNYRFMENDPKAVEAKQAYDLYRYLYAQTRGGAFGMAFLNPLTLGTIKNPLFGGDKDKQSMAKAFDYASTTQPITYGIGNSIGEGLSAAAVSGVLNDFKFMQKLSNGNLLERLLAGRATSLFPDIINAAQETENTTDFAKLLAQQQAKGLMLDGVLEGLKGSYKAPK